MSLRLGPWLFAVHGRSTLTPDLQRMTREERASGLRGFSLWWLWFEVACVWERRDA